MSSMPEAKQWVSRPGHSAVCLMGHWLQQCPGWGRPDAGHGTGRGRGTGRMHRGQLGSEAQQWESPQKTQSTEAMSPSTDIQVQNQ